jgi:hypothetical protein
MKSPLNGLYRRAITALVDAVIRQGQKRPYEHLAGYMERFWLVPPSRWTLGCGVRLHHVLRSDHDRDMHTHPWWNVSLILRNSYWEVMPCGLGDRRCHVGGYVNLNEPFRIAQRKPGHLVFRRRTARHKLMLFRGPVWTLMLTGPDKGQGWGYFVPGEGLIDRADYAPRRVS